MRTGLKSAFAVLALAGAAWAAPANAQSFGVGVGFGPQGGIDFSYDSGGYCDQWGCPDDFWDMPVYYGPVFFGGSWFDGPVYYRDGYGGREFWIHGGWHRDEWRGPHPTWWREGRFGPALGMNFYQSHGFHGRWDNNGRGFNQRGFDNRRDFGRGDNRGQFNGRQNNAGQFNNAQPGNREFDRRDGFGQRPQNNAPQDHGDRNFRGGQNNAPQQQHNTPPANTGGGRGGEHHDDHPDDHHGGHDRDHH